MKKHTSFMVVAFVAIGAFAGVVSAANWRDGLKVGQCKAHVFTSGSTCEVSFRGTECNLPSLNGTPAPGGVCVTARGSFKTGDDPAVIKPHEERENP